MPEPRTILAGCVGLSFFVWGMVGVSIGALLPNATTAFALSPATAGLVFVLWSVGFSVGSLISERVLKVAGATPLLVVLSAMAALASWAQALSSGYGTFLAIYLALGLSGGAIFTASHTLFGHLFPRRRASALAILDLVFSLGNMAAPLLIVVLLDRDLAWQSFFAVTGCGFASVAALFAVQSWRDGSISQRAAADHGPRRPSTRLPASQVMWLALASFALGATEWSQNVWFITYAIDRGSSPGMARICLSTFTAGMIVARVVIMSVRDADRSGGVMNALFLSCATGSLMVLLASAEPLILSGNFLLGTGIGALFPVFLGRAMDRHPASAATCSMIMIVALTLGGQAASLALGVIAERNGTLVAFRMTLVFVALTIAAFSAYRRVTAPVAPPPPDPLGC